MVKRLIWPSSIFPKLRSGTVQRFSRAGGKYSSKTSVAASARFGKSNAARLAAART